MALITVQSTAPPPGTVGGPFPTLAQAQQAISTMTPSVLASTLPANQQVGYQGTANCPSGPRTPYTIVDRYTTSPPFPGALALGGHGVDWFATCENGKAIASQSVYPPGLGWYGVFPDPESAVCDMVGVLWANNKTCVQQPAPVTQPAPPTPIPKPAPVPVSSPPTQAQPPTPPLPTTSPPPSTCCLTDDGLLAAVKMLCDCLSKCFGISSPPDLGEAGNIMFNPDAVGEDTRLGQYYGSEMTSLVQQNNKDAWEQAISNKFQPPDSSKEFFFTQ